VLDIEEHYAAVRPGIPAELRQLLKRYVELGHLGIKSGKGFYADYEEKALTRWTRALIAANLAREAAEVWDPTT
jgi:3-hydroxyacyl-CoA dehydrogenase